MLDKLDVRTGPGVPFGTSFEWLLQGLPRRFPTSARLGWHVYDLRSAGMMALLHTAPATKDHKVEFIGVGKMQFGVIEEHLVRIFAQNPGGFHVQRVDFCVDVPDVDVTWFRDHCYARFRRSHSEVIGRGIDSVLQTKRGIPTLYIGNKRDQFVFYDKTAERLYEIRREMRGRSRAAVLARFTGQFGHDPARIVTRIERRLRPPIPKRIRTVKALRKNAPSFNPFEGLAISKVGNCYSERAGSARDYLQLLGTAELVRRYGLVEARRILNQKSGGHASRYLERLRDVPPDGPDIDALKLFAAYQQTVIRQMN